MFALAKVESAPYRLSEAVRSSARTLTIHVCTMEAAISRWAVGLRSRLAECMSEVNIHIK